MMSMRRMLPFTIVMLLVMQTTLVHVATPVQAASGRGGTNDDFTVNTITVGNASASADQWIQSDGSVMDYIFIDQTIDVTVTVQRFGQSGIGEDAPVSLDIVHPIGFVMESFSFNTNLLTGGQSYNHVIQWTPTAAHSVLNTTTNDLSGGLILRATVAFSDDDKNTNDVREKTVPVPLPPTSWKIGRRNLALSSFRASTLLLVATPLPRARGKPMPPAAPPVRSTGVILRRVATIPPTAKPRDWSTLATCRAIPATPMLRTPD